MFKNWLPAAVWSTDTHVQEEGTENLIVSLTYKPVEPDTTNILCKYTVLHYHQALTFSFHTVKHEMNSIPDSAGVFYGPTQKNWSY